MGQHTAQAKKGLLSKAEVQMSVLGHNKNCWYFAMTMGNSTMFSKPFSKALELFSVLIIQSKYCDHYQAIHIIITPEKAPMKNGL